MKKKTEEFKVTDKRIFDKKGNLKTEFKGGKKSKTSSAKATKDKKKAKAAKDAKKADKEQKQTYFHAADFNSFILSLSSSAYVYLGVIEDPITKKKETNLQAAKQMIDILSMLKEKTKGNLESNEEGLIGNILYELQMQYLNKSKAIKI